MAGELNPYAAPSRDEAPEGRRGQDGEDDRAYRDGDLLRLPRVGGRLPRRCCICNVKARDHVHRQQLYWHPQGLYFLVLISPLIYVIVAMVIRKSATVEVYLCNQHQARRKNGIALLIGGVVLLVLGFVIGANSQSGGVVLFAVLAFLVALIAGIVMMRTVTAATMDDRYVWLRVQRPFLDSIRRSA